MVAMKKALRTAPTIVTAHMFLRISRYSDLPWVVLNRRICLRGSKLCGEIDLGIPKENWG